jgi:hypothetical protein
MMKPWSSVMRIAADTTSNIVSLSAFRAGRIAAPDPRFMTPVVEFDSWYHREEIAKATQKPSTERQ